MATVSTEAVVGGPNLRSRTCADAAAPRVAAGGTGGVLAALGVVLVVLIVLELLGVTNIFTAL